MTPTLRRLNDRERYYGLTWPGWVALAVAGGILYGGGPRLPVRAPRDRDRRRSRARVRRERRARTAGADDRPGRYLLALYRYRRAAKQLAPPTGLTSSGSSSTSHPAREGEREPVLDGAAA